MPIPQIIAANEQKNRNASFSFEGGCASIITYISEGKGRGIYGQCLGNIVDAVAYGVCFELLLFPVKIPPNNVRPKKERRNKSQKYTMSLHGGGEESTLLQRLELFIEEVLVFHGQARLL